MNTCSWICHVCNFGKPPELTSCSNCGAQAKKANSNTHDTNNEHIKSAEKYFSELSVIQKSIFIAISISSSIGVLIMYTDSAKLNLIGLALIIFGVFVFAAIRNNVLTQAIKAAREVKESNKSGSHVTRLSNNSH